MKVKQQIKDNTPTNNSIVESFQEKEILNNAINDYGYINSKK